jgi:hypothetical protein
MSRGSFGAGRATAVNFSHRFSNTVRPQSKTHSRHKKPLPRRDVEDIGADDASSATNEDDFEKATALHNCMYTKPLIIL